MSIKIFSLFIRKYQCTRKYTPLTFSSFKMYMKIVYHENSHGHHVMLMVKSAIAVDLYIENQANFRDVGNVALKPWQNELMKYIQPHDREIIWFLEKMAMKEKIGSKNMLNLCMDQEKW